MGKRIFLFLAGWLLAVYQPVLGQYYISLDNDQGTGINWMVAPQADIGADSLLIFKPGYDTSGWVKAVVPGTVFTSYVQAGLEKDPNYGDNIYQVEQSEYDRNFWYRTTFVSPVYKNGQKVWLNFEGINRKGVIFLNGARLGKLDGFMEQGKYDVTALLKKDEENVLAVLVYVPIRPIPNYASPTYISSDGWDWMPPVPGLEMGITDDVYLSITGGVTLEYPWIRTQVPALDTGVISLQVGLYNASKESKKGVLGGLIQPGNIRFAKEIQVGAGKHLTYKFDTAQFKQLIINNPELWWPNGYGKPHLYTCDLKFTVDGEISDSRKITFGIREYSYDTIGGVLHLAINGTRIFIKGGNWGMSEYLLRCRDEQYDLRVRLHKAMHLNMIRNWLGSVTDEEFYDACDKYGIMVWDDFWLNSHPNLPRDLFAFNRNAVEKIKRLRNHPSIAVWCGDNEGYPLPPLNGWLAEDVATFDGGDRWYQANSHADALTGSGPWTNFKPQWYFTKYPGGFGGNTGWGLRTEIGTAVFPTFASFKKFIPREDWWPRNEMWNKHFFGKSAANAGPDRYMKGINDQYGAAAGIKDFCRKAQLLNIETNKAIFEGWLQHLWNDASGVMLWMSQSAYPSMVWQTYDYYYDLTGAFWGVKKACEPLHIQWSYANDTVKVINTTSRNYNSLFAEATVYDLDGKEILHQSTKVSSYTNTATPCFKLDFAANSLDLAYDKKIVASSTSGDAAGAGAVADNNQSSRWSSDYSDDQWIYVDLGRVQQVGAVLLHWEAAYAKAYKLQVSDDAMHWKTVHMEKKGAGGIEKITFGPVEVRYIRMLGLERATRFGYSLYAFKVYEKKAVPQPKVQFIRLALQNAKGEQLSDNFYWRSTQGNDYTALNSLDAAKLKVRSTIKSKGQEKVIEATIRNPASADDIAFAIDVQAIRAKDGRRILPALMSDNYFTLFPGETKKITIRFNKKILGDSEYQLLVRPYNHPY